MKSGVNSGSSLFRNVLLISLVELRRVRSMSIMPGAYVASAKDIPEARISWECHHTFELGALGALLVCNHAWKQSHQASAIMDKNRDNIVAQRGLILERARL